jgi:hypothetical protein
LHLPPSIPDETLLGPLSGIEEARHQAAIAKAMRARAEEDARGPVYTDEQETALMAARRRRAIAALDEQ